MIDTNLLYYLIAVYEAGNLTKAAKRLHLSQQALGRSMKKIEDELQVSLFNRTKNKIELNSYGQIAVDYAYKIINQISEMEDTIKTLEKQNRTIAIGSCAPRPLNNLCNIITSLFDTISLTTEINASNDELISGLFNETYQLIILTNKLKDDRVICKLWGKEELYFSLPVDHPLASKETLSFKDIDGETLILYKNIGFWKNLVTSSMPNTHFIIEENRDNFIKLIQRSDFICFSSDLAIKKEGQIENRIIKKINDNDAIIPFYIACLKKNYTKYQTIFDQLDK